MLKRSWLSYAYDTFKTCASVFIVTAVIAGSLLIIRLVGEKKLQRFLSFILFFRRKEPKLDLVSETFVPEIKSN